MPSIERFNQRWASSGQTDEITDNNAELGLAFIGDDPPTIELHNKMFQWLDDKDNLLFNWINEVYKERTGISAGITAETNTLLRDAVATAASTTKTGIQRNGTLPEVAALLLNNVTVTPAALKPLIDALNLAITNAVPTSAVMAFSRNNAPPGWLACNGDSVSRVTYAQLFSVIGTTYGSVDSNSFNLPDLRHKVVRGWPAGSAGPDAGRALGSTQLPSNNAHTHVLTMGAVPEHTHGFTTSTVANHTHTPTMGADGGHTHTITVVAAGGHSHTISVAGNGDHMHGGFTSDSGAHTHSVKEGSVAPGGSSGDLLSSGDDLTRIINNYSNTLGGGDHAHAIFTTTTGYHGHTASAAAVANHTHTASAAAVADHTHTLSLAAAGGHSHTGTTDADGAVSLTGTIASEGGETRMLNISLLYCIKT